MSKDNIAAESTPTPSELDQEAIMEAVFDGLLTIALIWKTEQHLGGSLLENIKAVILKTPMNEKLTQVGDIIKCDPEFAKYFSRAELSTLKK